MAIQGKGLLAAWVVVGDFGSVPGVAGAMAFSSREKAQAAARTWAIPQAQIQQVLIQIEDGRIVDPRWLDTVADALTGEPRPTATLRIREGA